MTELEKRLLTALVAIPVLIWVFVKGGLPFFALIVVMMVAGLWEFFALMESRGFHPMKITGHVGALGLIIVAQYSDERVLNTLLTVVILTILLIQLRKEDVRQAISGISVTIFGVLYVPWLLAHALLLRNWPGRDPALHLVGDDPGRFFTFLVIGATMINDAGGYFVGRAWGRHPIAPRISPKKTWEGTAGGVVAAAGCTLLIKTLFWSTLPVVHCLALGVIVGVFGYLGDLVESLLKRDAQIKDSGTLFPGHGGVLDRLDSLLFTIPVSYYYLRFFFS